MCANDAVVVSSAAEPRLHRRGPRTPLHEGEGLGKSAGPASRRTALARRRQATRAPSTASTSSAGKNG